MSVDFENRLLASGCTDRHVMVWKLHSGEPILASRPHSLTVSVVKFCPLALPDDPRRYLISAGLDGNLVMWTYDRRTSAL